MGVKESSVELELYTHSTGSLIVCLRVDLTLYSNTRESTEALLSESKGYADILVRKATEYLLASGR